jgi:hypothetical protein
VVAVCTAQGYRRIPDDVLGDVVTSIVAGRQERPGGPTAPLGA